MAVLQQLEHMHALFEKWSLTGVPKGIDYPKTLTDAVGWRCVDYGITGVGSKRDLNTEHKTYGPLCKQIDALIKKLEPSAVKRSRRSEPPVEKPKRSRPYVPVAIRELSVSDKIDRLEAQVTFANGKLHEIREKFDRVTEELAREQITAKRLAADLQNAQSECAELKRQLAAQSGRLHLVK